MYMSEANLIAISLLDAASFSSVKNSWKEEKDLSLFSIRQKYKVYT